MGTLADVETAKRRARRRARMLPVLGILFIAGQPLYFGPGGAAEPVRAAAWLAWALVLLGALAFMGAGVRGGAVRDLIEDEGTQANRLRGYAAGFWAGATVALYAFSLFDQVKGREALHLVLTVAVGAALIRFGTLERRALAYG
jgi:hypothetical protein